MTHLSAPLSVRISARTAASIILWGKDEDAPLLCSPRGVELLAEISTETLVRAMERLRPGQKARVVVSDEVREPLFSGISEDEVYEILAEIEEPLPMLMGELTPSADKTEYFHDFRLLLTDRGVDSAMAEEMLYNGSVRIGWDHEVFVHPVEGYLVDRIVTGLESPTDIEAQDVRVAWCPLSLSAALALLPSEEFDTATLFFRKMRPTSYAQAKANGFPAPLLPPVDPELKQSA